jgi:hypothetical protein
VDRTDQASKFTVADTTTTTHPYENRGSLIRNVTSRDELRASPGPVA